MESCCRRDHPASEGEVSLRIFVLSTLVKLLLAADSHGDRHNSQRDAEPRGSGWSEARRRLAARSWGSSIRDAGTGSEGRPARVVSACLLVGPWFRMCNPPIIVPEFQRRLAFPASHSLG